MLDTDPRNPLANALARTVERCTGGTIMVEIAFDEHLQSLKQRFPETPDAIVLKSDVLRDGICFTEDLAEIGKWAIPSGAFLSREDAPNRAIRGTPVSVPSLLILDDDTRINTELDHTSPYSVRPDGETTWMLCRHGEPVTRVSFAARPEFEGSLRDGSPVDRALGQRAEHCAAIVHTVFCEYGRDGDECTYCFLGNVQKGEDGSRIRGSSRRRSIEACAAAAHQIRLDHVVVSGGAFIDTSLEVKSYVKTISALREAVGPETRITAVCQAFDEPGWRALKDAGASRVQPNLEVWADELWPKIVPGKAKAIGKTKWLERLRQAVDVFGVGDVATNFVAGVELADPNGMRSPAEAIASHLEAYESLLNDCIVPIFGFLTKARGTRYENVELPATEFFLELGWERTRLMRDAGMFDHYGDGVDADFSCYKCVSHKTCQDYPRLMQLAG